MLITKTLIADWVGSDNLKSDDLLQLIADILNGYYSPEELKNDVLDYANLLED